MTPARIAELREILPKVEDADFWPCDRAELSALISAAERVTIMTAARLAELDLAAVSKFYEEKCRENVLLAEERDRLRAEVERRKGEAAANFAIVLRRDATIREITQHAEDHQTATEAQLGERNARIADLERKLAERQWRTMESAPKDGTLILVLLDTGDVTKAHFEHRVWWGVSNRKPTLWMPLPDTAKGG